MTKNHNSPNPKSPDPKSSKWLQIPEGLNFRLFTEKRPRIPDESLRMSSLTVSKASFKVMFNAGLPLI